MDGLFLFIAFIVLVALIFDFINGFHDAANAIATIVATRVLSPVQAVAWAACFNFMAIFVMGTGVAKTVGNGLVDISFVTPHVILAGLFGAIAWNLLTWWLKIPSSSSHTLIGAYAGAAMSHVYQIGALAHPWDVLIAGGWGKTLLFIVVAPLIGMGLAFLLMVANAWLFRRVNGRAAAGWFRKAQLVSSAFMSLTHGGNDAQKTAGIITGVLLTAGYIKAFEIPMWVLWSAYITIGLGTLAGGWRIVQTMGCRLTRLKPSSGFCAETAAAASIFLATEFKMPISTTHVITGAIVGVGAVQRLKAVRWNVAGNIIWAWILTIPVSALFGGGAMFIVRLFS